MSGFLGQVAGGLSAARGVAGAVGSLGNPAGGFLGDLSGSATWVDALQDASWAGIPFVVLESTVVRGRRTAMHEYPNRDVVWVEDLGKRARRCAFTGFVVGDDCYDQAQALGDAADLAGPAELVHPSFGSVQAVCVEFSHGERAENGRVVELQLAFVVAQQPVYPAVAPDTQGAVATAAVATNTAAAGDFSTGILSAGQQGLDVATHAIGVVGGFVVRVTSAVGDAALLAHSCAGLVSSVTGTTFGRFDLGTRTGPLGGAIGTVGQALAAATAARSVVISAGRALNAAASLL